MTKRDDCMGRQEMARIRFGVMFLFVFSGIGSAQAQDLPPQDMAGEEQARRLEDAARADRERRYEEALALYGQGLELETTTTDEQGYIVLQMALIEEKRANPAQAIELLRAHWDVVSTSHRVTDLDLFVARLERQVTTATNMTSSPEPSTGIRVSASDLERRNAMRGPWVTMGGGFLMAVAGGALILGSGQEQASIERFERECEADPSLCDGADLDQATRRANAKLYGGIPTVGVGVATLAGGIVWYIRRKRQLEEREAARHLLEFAPLITHHGGRSYQGLGVSVNF